MIDPQNYDGRPIYTNFEGECAEKKRNFSVNFFQKVPKNAFFGLFLSKLTKFSKVNENSNPPPFEKILDPPLIKCMEKSLS